MSGTLLVVNSFESLPPGMRLESKSPVGVHEEASFVSWLLLFCQIARGKTAVSYVNRCVFPALVAQRRMVHRLALAYAVAPRGTRWPLGGGLAQPPAQGLPDSHHVLGIGAQRPAVVLVGDRPQPGAARWAAELGWPFISGLYSGCSSWLAEQLELGGIPEEQLMWMNARYQSGTYDYARLEELALRQNKEGVAVIALGKHAAFALKVVGVKHEEVHHPQHWKRFHHHEPYYLPRLIRKFLRRQRRAA